MESLKNKARNLEIRGGIQEPRSNIVQEGELCCGTHVTGWDADLWCIVTQ